MSEPPRRPDTPEGQEIALRSALPRRVRAARRRLGERLLEHHLINPQQLAHALEVQSKGSDEFLGHILVSLGYVAAKQIGALLEEMTGVSHVDLTTYPIDPTAARLVPEKLVVERLVLPLRAEAGQVWLAMADPLDLDTIDVVQMQTGLQVVPLLALPTELLPIINRSYDMRARAEQALSEIEAPEEEVSTQDLLHQAENAPIVRLVNTVMEGAFNQAASDIHLEPQDNGLRVRYRVDGLLYEQMVIPRSNQAAVVSRIKVMAHLDIAERRRPQDGRISRVHQGRAYDLRVSTMPTVHGEKAVLRVLDKAAMAVSLDKIGFLPDELAVWQHLITRPYGMVLVTGPTGSGKSTTLYASLNQINDTGKNITTIEDPVEYQLRGINQTQVNARAGVTFASGLRTLVRQDPDILLVGEIRDRETAEIAINAALTGHLVLATLHTNDAPGAIVRLDNMGIEPFLISSSVLGVIGQRLVRKVCAGCREWYVPEPGVLEGLGVPVRDENGEPIRLARGRGCRDCNGKQYRDRTAVFEVMTVTDDLRAGILRRDSSVLIKQQAIRDGMRPMRQSAIQKVLAGITTPDEVSRVLLGEDL